MIAINENKVLPNNMRLYLMGARLNALARMNVFLGEGIAETTTSAKSVRRMQLLLLGAPNWTN